ncbi:MAG: zf-TFIIB domain-containing protein [Phenylobacterium sp.]|uniref:TFIIB-type zinc ribbon-containing protein n=1 Tax=Phenylobacterium sp. TaxID=1871053 RepID=UPI002734FA3C|nr:zf-TFIIB domain-containing protein [Phenylobacterium sp.]MDP3173199.1 zf-TFIIB domain-containing protein [Phenylobacterium sp.]
MPLLLCPNCNASMQNVNRSGVELDMCPSCRGVWLDRGELEKILAGSREDVGARDRFEREVSAFHKDPDDWKKRHAYDAQQGRYRYGDDDERYRKKKRFDIFDIFD